MAQPIIRGIEAVGSVSLKYKYNSANNQLPIPTGAFSGFAGAAPFVDTTASGVDCAGFRLDSEFLRANQQIATSIMVPILGGGAIALTNNNRSGTLTLNTTRVSSPVLGAAGAGAMSTAQSGVGPVGMATGTLVYDIVLLAQIQQATPAGDSVGATITIAFDFNGAKTALEFQGCTVAQVQPIGLAGNDAANYGTVFNYLNWGCTFS